MRLDRYSKFFSFKKLDKLNSDALKAVATNANITLSQAGALKGRLMGDWSVYARMVKAGYKPELIPSYFARPPPGWSPYEESSLAQGGVALGGAAPQGGGAGGGAGGAGAGPQGQPLSTTITTMGGSLSYYSISLRRGSLSLRHYSLSSLSLSTSPSFSFNLSRE